jgi:hypothetical protein
MLIWRLFPLLFTLLALPCAAIAQSDDAAYCASLTSLANRYLTGGTLGGREMQDIDTSEAMDDCRRGNTAAGIPVLERKLKNDGFTLPKR